MPVKKLLMLSALLSLSVMAAESKIKIIKQDSKEKVNADECDKARYEWGWLENKEGCRDDKGELVSASQIAKRIIILDDRKKSLSSNTYAGIKMYSNLHDVLKDLKQRGRLDDKGRYMINDFLGSFQGRVNTKEIDTINLHQVGLRSTSKYKTLSAKFQKKYEFIVSKSSELSLAQVKRQNRERTKSGSLFVHSIINYEKVYRNKGDRIRLILSEKNLVANNKEYDISIIYETKELVDLEEKLEKNERIKAKRSVSEIDEL